MSSIDVEAQRVINQCRDIERQFAVARPPVVYFLFIL